MRSIRMIILLIIFAPLVFSFSFFKSKKPRDYEDMANEISAKVAKKLAKKHQMDWIGEGGGMMGSVYLIGLSFQIHHPLDRDEARERIVDCVEELLAAVNANEEIRPFLRDYPFTPKNVRVIIYSNHPDGREAFDPYISVVSVYTEDGISFSTTEPNKNTYKHRYRESYSKALAMLKGNQAMKVARPSRPVF
jgi:hypothetical protein